MRVRTALLTLAVTLPLVGQASAGDVFLGDTKVFSGVASENGEGLIVPQTVISGSNFGLQTRVDNEVTGEFALVATVGGGEIATGLAAFPTVPTAEFDIQARVLGDDMVWGLRPYVGIGMTTTTSESRVFQGIAQLLPYETDTVGVQGVAGIAYELMPGIGAGLEYRYQTYTSEAPVTARPSETQTIMMRLDLGLN